MRNNYRITPDTMAIFPKYNTVYQSTILEYHQTVTKEEKPLDIIKENCLHYGSSYHGRIASVQHHLNFKQKTPVPIQPTKEIYSFPTQSASSFDCIWLFFHAIKHIESKEHHSFITFINCKIVNIDTSYYAILKQYNRTGMVKVLMEQFI